MPTSLDSALQLLDHDVYGLSLRALATAFAIVFASLLLRRLVVGGVLGAFHRWAEKTEREWDEQLIAAVRAPLEAAVVVYGVWLAARVFLVQADLADLAVAFDTVRRVGLLLIAGWAVFRIVAVVDRTLRQRAADPDDPFDLGLVPLFTNSGRIVAVMVFGTMIAQELGYSVGGLVASLGLGGAAVALASRDAVANLFGFVMIMVDKPFSVGDWIRGDSFEGVVEEIGFRSTRIRTFGKTVENIPNNVMANANVENMDRRRDAHLNVRRIKMTIGVTYSTTTAQMEGALEAIRTILREDEGVDRRMTMLVNFTDFGASSLDIFIYYFSNRADWAYYLAVRERVNLKIMRALEDLGLSFAFPSQSLYVEKMPDDFGRVAGEAGRDVAREDLPR